MIQTADKKEVWDSDERSRKYSKIPSILKTIGYLYSAK
jgi:hypothetical protein